MCNLFENTVSFSDLVEAFGTVGKPVLKPGPESAPNLPLFEAVRPTDFAPVVCPLGEGTEFLRMRWGFIPERPPNSSKKAAGPITNFKSEKRRFSNLEDRGRCLIPATAFFEFTGSKYPKTRWRFAEAGQPWFCLAGLWRRYDDQTERFTLLTTGPGPDMAPYHDRQVVLLARDAWSAWLSGGPEEGLLKPGPAGQLTVRRASPEPPEAALPLFGAAK